MVAVVTAVTAELGRVAGATVADWSVDAEVTEQRAWASEVAAILVVALAVEMEALE